MAASSARRRERGTWRWALQLRGGPAVARTPSRLRAPNPGPSLPSPNPLLRGTGKAQNHTEKCTVSFNHLPLQVFSESMCLSSCGSMTACVCMSSPAPYRRPRILQARTVIQQCSKAKVKTKPALDGADAQWAEVGGFVCVFIVLFHLF